MKKLLGIVVLCLLFCNTGFTESNYNLNDPALNKYAKSQKCSLILPLVILLLINNTNTLSYYSREGNLDTAI